MFCAHAPLASLKLLLVCVAYKREKKHSRKNQCNCSLKVTEEQAPELVPAVLLGSTVPKFVLKQLWRTGHHSAKQSHHSAKQKSCGDLTVSCQGSCAEPSTVGLLGSWIFTRLRGFKSHSHCSETCGHLCTQAWCASLPGNNPST